MPSVRFTALTLFPEMFSAIREEGVVSRALGKGLIDIRTVFLRDFSLDARKNVDDHPIGGGDGMVLRADVAEAALQSVLKPESVVIHLTPAGKVFNRSWARALAEKSDLIFLCGRYAGFDARFVAKHEHHALSLGDFVLSGGELACLCLIDAIARFIPGVLGNEASAREDSFEQGLLEAPPFTKPLDFEGRPVPEVLLSGNHGKIAAYRRRESLVLTAKNRPDLIAVLWDDLSRSEKALVERVWKHG